MNKAQLVEKVQSQCNYELSKACVEDIMNNTLEAIKKEVSKGGTVQLIGFGTFSSFKRAARKCKNPQTGEMMTVKACKTPKFKPGTDFKEMVKR